MLQTYKQTTRKFPLFFILLLMVSNLLLQCKCDSEPVDPTNPPNRSKKNTGAQPTKPKPEDPTNPGGGTQPTDPPDTPLTDPIKPEDVPPTDPTNPDDTPPKDPTKPEDIPPKDPTNPDNTPPTGPTNPDDIPPTTSKPTLVDTVAIDAMIQGFKNGNADVLVDVLEQIKVGQADKINQQDSNHEQRTALNIAVSRGNKDMVELLLKNNADVNIPNEHGKLPLEVAANRSTDAKGIMQLLLAHEANINAEDDQGNSLLHRAIKEKKNEVVERLLSFQDKLDINAKNNDSYGALTPLHLAVNNKQTSIVELLLKHQADLKAKDIDGYTPFYTAIMNDDEDTAKILFAKHADVINTADNNGITPLQWAINQANSNMENYLRTTGAKK